jgi:hypothetical protein
MERIPLKVSQGQDPSFEEYLNQDQYVDSSLASDAAFNLAWKDSAVGLWARNDAVNELKDLGGKKLSPEEANEMYPWMETPFKEEVSPALAMHLAEQDKEKFDLKRKMDQGPTDAWSQTKQFGAGVLAHMLDPIEVGAGMLTGWGIGGAATRGLLGQTAKSIALKGAAEGAGIGAKLAATGAENLAGNILENVTQEGVQKLVEAKEQVVDQRTSGDIATDILINSLAATSIPIAIKSSVHFSAEGFKRIFRSTSPEADLAVVRHVVQSGERGGIPDSGPILKALSQETDVGTYKGVAFEYSPITRTPEGKVIFDKPFFVARSVEGSKPLGDDLGLGGTHATSNGGVANAAAARSMSDSVGEVAEVKLSELNPLDIDRAFPPEIAPTIEAELKRLGFDTREIDVNKMTAKEIIQLIRNATDSGMLDRTDLMNVRKIIEDGGYDSLISDGSSVNGFPHNKHNHLVVFDDKKLLVEKTEAADPSQVRKPPPEDLDAARKYNETPREFLDDLEATQKFEQDMEVVAIEADRADFMDRIESDLETLQSLKDQGTLSNPKIIDEIKQDMVEAEEGFKILKAFKHCMTRF